MVLFLVLIFRKRKQGISKQFLENKEFLNSFNVFENK